MSRKGVADALTDDHRAGREDERNRIENSVTYNILNSTQGGYVTCRNGIWRVQDSLAVSRAIGDLNMKEWIISEPETETVQLTPDCEFLIVASDGLWDKVYMATTDFAALIIHIYHCGATIFNSSWYHSIRSKARRQLM
ncbi:hypothetical protein BHM03_00038512 [Ensete ventricosum]|nr:hypothetical protein BHM03_00038512 [Ensete ventricosum]